QSQLSPYVCVPVAMVLGAVGFFTCGASAGLACPAIAALFYGGLSFAGCLTYFGWGGGGGGGSGGSGAPGARRGTVTGGVGIGTVGGNCSQAPPPRPHATGDQAADASEGVCAKVRIQLDQTAVMARSVFTGAMEITNGGSVGNLTGVRI